jgi:GLPGLI family protein
MKQFLILAAMLLCGFCAGAQTAGEISYRETVQLKIEMPEADERLKKMIPPAQHEDKKLTFNESESLYETAGKPGAGDIDMRHEDDGNEVHFVMKMPQNILYTNLDEETIINKKEFFGRDFLITGKQRDCKWKLTGEQKTVGNYVCQKAVLQDTSENTIAWFSPQIPVSAGPAGYGKLPGMILEMEMDNGQRTITVTGINLKSVPKGEIKAPEGGKKVTQEEFKVIQDEKLKEMGVEMGGKGGGVRIQIISEERH